MYQERVDPYSTARDRTYENRTLRIPTAVLVAYLFLFGLCFAQTSSAAESLSILFLGDCGPHEPAVRARQLIPLMETRGIHITYTESLGDLDPATLAQYEGLVIFADQDTIQPAQEKALLDYVASGKGLVAIHSASSCFLNSPKYVALVGAQFKHHSVGVFRARVINADHPVMKDFKDFETLDETYVHTKPSQDCTVLQVRREGDRDEPWTWVRTHGQGRVFYTAYGHDEHTWDNPAFQSLMERAIRWACGSNSVIATR